MLVLSRHRDEKIIIGHGPDRIEIVVVDIRGDKVRLGIDAPQDVTVHREEVYDDIARRELQREEARKDSEAERDMRKQDEDRQRAFRERVARVGTPKP